MSRSAFPTSTAGDKQILARGSLSKQSRAGRSLDVLSAANPASQAAILGWTPCKGCSPRGSTNGVENFHLIRFSHLTLSGKEESAFVAAVSQGCSIIRRVDAVCSTGG